MEYLFVTLLADVTGQDIRLSLVGLRKHLLKSRYLIGSEKRTFLKK